MQFEYANMPGRGLRPRTVKSIVTNRVGATPVILGQVVMTDTKAVDADSSKTETNVGAAGFPINNVVTPTTAGIGVLGTAAADPGYWFGVVTSLGTAGTGADNTEIEVTWQGYVSVLITTGTTGEYGKVLFPANTATGVTTTGAAGVKGVGRVLQDTTTSATLALALWDGIGGAFGGNAAS